MNLVPTKATVGIASRMVREASDNGADVVLEHLRRVAPDQLPALVGVLAKWAANQPVVNIDIPSEWSTDPAWICGEATIRAARHFGVDAIGVRHGRAEHYTRARFVAMAAARHAGVSYSEIGRQYERDHSTAMSADRHVQRRADLLAIALSIGEDLRSPMRVVA